MTAAPALIAPEATPIHKTMLLLTALGTAKSIWPAGLLEGCLALLFGAVQLQELRQRHSSLELDPVHGHGISLGTHVPVWPAGPGAELATESSSLMMKAVRRLGCFMWLANSAALNYHLDFFVV